jgi:DNA-binding CsgD family transcriptional regulator
MADETISRLLGMLCATASAPRGWDDFLQGLCAACGVNKAALLAHDLGRNDHRILASQGDTLKAGGPSYESYYWQFDEWTVGFARRGASGRVLQGEEVWPEPNFRASVFHNEFLKQQDIFQLLGIPYASAPGIFESISLEVALETRRRFLALESRNSDLEIALHALSNALVLVDVTGRAILVNKQASIILGKRDGLFLNKGRIITGSPQVTANLQGLIDRAIATSTGTHLAGGGAMPIPRNGKRSLHILVSPISPSDSMLHGEAAAAIFLDDPELQPLIPTEVLRTLFGLTPAEARLATSLAEGRSLTEIADHGRVGRETVKSQMSAVLAKTGTHRQGELIRLLSRLPLRAL